MRQARRPQPHKRTPFSELGGIRGIILALFVISGVVNLLTLTGSFYMMQVYDRALTSQSLPTLLALSILALGLYAFQGSLDILRSQVLVRIGSRLDAKLAPEAHRVTIDMPRFGFSSAEATERSRDVDTLRAFISGQGPIALFDLPWMPLYLIFVYLLHPWLGLLTVGGALTLAGLTVLTELLMQKRSQAATKAAVARATIIDSHARNSEIIRALGMSDRVVTRFEVANREHLNAQTKSYGITGTFGGISKVLRMILQSAVLGLGALLTIKGDMSAGAIIAASVASGRAMAPIDMAIAQWRGLVGARKSYARLVETLSALDRAPPSITMPAPHAILQVDKMTVAAPTTGLVVISEVSFEIKAGEAVGIIGPSGGGKSTLARALVGVWPTLRGDIRFDGAEMGQWAPDVLGAKIGYLPQDVALMDGTVGENIARFDPGADDKKILAAAAAARVHDMIVRLPQGYDTKLGPSGTALSAGQRQRIALARALYDDPFMVVLDEPNSNLDAAGESALTDAIKDVRKRGGIVIVIAHRPSALAAVDIVGVFQSGRLSAIGPKDKIFAQQLQSVPPPPKRSAA